MLLLTLTSYCHYLIPQYVTLSPGLLPKLDLLRPLKNHGLIVFILTYTPWLLCHGFASVRILSLAMSDSVWNRGRSLVL